jgi:hypothetical protein
MEENTPPRSLLPLCKIVEIRREVIVPQNDVIERNNRSIEEYVNAMMNNQNLSMFLWGKVVMAFIYVQNRSHHHILKNMTPKESFSGKEAKC